MPDYRDIESRLREQVTLAAYTIRRTPIRIAEQEMSVNAAVVTGSYFGVVGVQPAVGGLDSTDMAAVALSFDFWETQFQRDPAILGRTIAVNGYPARVRAVMPKGFAGTDYGRQVDLWLPLGSFGQPESESAVTAKFRDDRSLSVIGRLRAGGSLLACESILRSSGVELERTYVETNAHRRFIAVSFPHLLGPAERSTLGIDRLVAGSALLFITLLVLVYANIANLFAMRSILSQRDVAIRKALGGTEFRLVVEAFLDVAILVLPAIIAAWVVAALATVSTGQSAVHHFAGTAGLYMVLALVVGGVVAIGALGAAPALWAHAQDPMGAMKSADADTPLRNGRVLWGLVAVQIAIACCSLGAAYDGAQRARAMERANLGFDIDRVVDVRVQVDTGGDAQHALEAFVRSLPTVESVAVAESPLLEDKPLQMPISFQGRAFAAGQTPSVRFDVVSPGYFKTIGLPVQAGGFTPNASTTPSFSEAIVNRAFAQRFLQRGRELGDVILLRERYPVRVVGIVGNMISDASLSPDEPRMYVARLRRSNGEFELLIRTNGRAESHVGALSQALADSRLIRRSMKLEALSERRDNMIRPVRNIARGLGLLTAAVALFVSIGVHGILAVALASARRSTAIRIALGAPVLRIVATSLRPVGLTLLTGVVLAMLIAIASRETSNTSTLTLNGILAAFPIIAAPIVFACAPPIYRMLSRSPADVLRI